MTEKNDERRRKAQHPEEAALSYRMRAEPWGAAPLAAATGKKTKEEKKND